MSWLYLCLLQQADLEGETDELGTVGEPELLHDSRAVGVHRLPRDEEFLADLARAVALGREGHHLLLAGAELPEAGSIRIRFGRPVFLKEELGGLRREIDLATRHHADRLGSRGDSALADSDPDDSDPDAEADPLS